MTPDAAPGTAGPEDLAAQNLARLHAFLTGPLPQGKACAPRIETLEGALVLPGSGQLLPGDPRLAERFGGLGEAFPRGTAFYDGGVYDAAGRLVEEAIHIGGGRRHVPGLLPSADRAERLEGTWLWGGVLHAHFGHFLTESIGRLWAWPEISPAPQGVIWLLPNHVGPRRAEQAQALPTFSYIGRILGLLGVAGPHRVATTRPLRVERLVVSSQLLANAGGGLITGHPAFHAFVRRLAEGAPPTGSGKPLYVSRAGMAKGGRFVLEEEIEAAFAAAGWDVLRPEKLDVAAQVAAYAAADRLVFAEGSALHLYALVARPDQRVAVLTRRAPAKRKFEVQLRGFGVQEAHTLDVVRATLLPTKPGPAGQPVPLPRKDGDAVLDCAALEQALVAIGFVAPGTWHGPTADRLDAAAEQVCAARSAEEPATPCRIFPREGEPLSVARLRAAASRHAGRAG
ncbi:glycosyltransferase 61 family protein [Falsiroseomonas oryzae]|uniref:glycosyltransferase 61 family protein n=1 Tax=Falsiroseomonas oryzae TaxID=2766473 RepID=UPI0022EB5B25|nr:glycosyltransferase 61 family protein [Roseomonas sp. MO-31]